MLTAQARGNYERIGTWRGVYGYRTRRSVPPSESRALKAQPLPESLVQEIAFRLEFAIDKAANRAYIAKSEPKLSWMDGVSGKPVTIAGTAVPEERVVIAPEYRVRFAPRQIYGAFQEVSEHPAARNRRAAFRELLESRPRGGHADRPLPESWFSFSQGRPYWEDMQGTIAAWEGALGAEKRGLLRQRLRLYRAPAPHGAWFREDREMETTAGTKQFARIVWSPDAGYNPVLFAIWEEGFGKRPVQSKQWRFKEVDGILVPAWVQERGYAREVVQWETEAALVECTLNQPIPAGQFGYAGLGMQDGDLLMDRIDGVCYILSGGEPVKLAEFGGKYGPGAVMWLRWVLAAVTVGVVGAIGLRVWRRRRWRRPPAE